MPVILADSILSVVGTVILAIAGTALLYVSLLWLITSIQYRAAISHFTSLDAQSSKGQPALPPVLPYSLPWLGQSLSFLSDKQGQFWTWFALKLAPYNLQAATILVGGRITHVVMSPATVLGLFKAKDVTRDDFVRRVVFEGMGMSKKEADLHYPAHEVAMGNVDTHNLKHEQHEQFSDHLLSTAAVNGLTSTFMEFFQNFLDQAEGLDDWKEVELYDWLKRIMFAASTKALFGEKIQEIIPDFCDAYLNFDHGMLAMMYGIPKVIKPEPYIARDRLIQGMENWILQMRKECNDVIPDAKDWDAHYGAPIIQARQQLFKKYNLSTKGIAVLEMGFAFGLNSNSLPGTGWMLTHILSPLTDSTLAPRLLGELRTALQPNNTIDIPTLVSLPLLNSAFHETLRLHVDVIVSRELNSNIVVDKYLLKKGNLIMAPSYLSHHDASFWNNHSAAAAEKTSGNDIPSVEEWWAERFLRHDPVTGKDTFTTNGTQGKFFPFGGGNFICPGRVFAKQEVLGAVACILLGFEIEVLGFTKRETDGKEGFPGVKKQYAGNGFVIMDGDLRVRIKRKMKWRKS